jgi:hemerythrin
MRLEWHDSMSIGHSVLDFQHRHLIYLLNGLSAALSEKNLEAAQYSILEFLELAEQHDSEEFVHYPKLDQRLPLDHFDAHVSATKLIKEIRELICNHANPEEIEIRCDQSLVEILIKMFQYDPEFRFRLLEPERRSTPRFATSGFLADISGNMVDVIDAYPGGLTLRTTLDVPEAFRSFGLIPKINSSVLVQEKIVVFGKPKRINFNTLLIELSADSKLLTAALFHRLFAFAEEFDQ